jgi:drug/metabolite transporter (DMT)-like permease
MRAKLFPGILTALMPVVLPMKMSKAHLIALFIFIVLSWGLAWPINKIGLQYMSPLWYTTTRLLIGACAMLSIVIATKNFSLPERKDIPLILIIGLLQISIYILLTNIGLAYLPAGRSSLIAYTTPLWVMPIATLFFKEEAGFLRWLGFTLALVGLIVLMNPWELKWHDHNFLLGSGALLLASLCWAISIICVRHMHWSKTPLELMPWQLLTGAVPVLIFAMYKEPNIQVTWNLPLISSLIYTGVLVTGISYWCAIIINKALPAVVLSLGFLIVPVFSFAVSAVYLKEVINLSTLTAIILIVLGLAFVVVEKNKPALTD